MEDLKDKSYKGHEHYIVNSRSRSSKSGSSSSGSGSSSSGSGSSISNSGSSVSYSRPYSE